MMRYFTRPEKSESLAQVFDDLFAARIGNFHVFKWRLAMALHGPVEQGVAVGDIWEAFTDAVSDRDALAAQLGWTRASIDTIDAYREVRTPYIFPTLTEIKAASAPYFGELSMDVPYYELGERCPLVCYV